METTLKTFNDSNGNTIQVEISNIGLHVKNRENYWVALSPHFKTFGYSKKSKEEAIQDFDRAIKLFFSIHAELGTLESTLQNFGWKKESNTFKQPKFFNSPTVNRNGSKVDHMLAIA